MSAAGNFLLQDQMSNIVIRENLSRTTGGKTIANLDFSVFLEVKRLKNMLKGLSALVLRIYVGASLAVWLFQADKINSIIAKAMNESSFIVLGGDFNKNGFHKCPSFKKCLDLGLVNFLGSSSYVKMPT
ncbi:hypothetical protein G9A89_010300 [Geosiphon pyriformis]|nr:hypothetical protein G9A89_010300 [Geosiphon pyriformis]